ncbi:sugar phosphorylase [Saccharicrinis sp. FJH54]|uniref:sugar phosphorylase n=1 Tax=Saccharicrinis sp. FJH54 TaxID=3344665 RepID=UPI0035D3EE7F
MEEMKAHLYTVYGSRVDDNYFKLFEELLDQNRTEKERNTLWDEKDIFLITYGDTLIREEEMPLRTLYSFLIHHFREIFSTIHILPFFPYSSDDGFAVKDFYRVNPELGDWEDIRKISHDFRLMADLVVNHASSQNDWFRQFLMGEAPGKEYFFVPEEDFNTRLVVRPRSTPLVTNYQSVSGVKKAWTTFSADQVDLNYNNPMLLLEVVKIVLWYIHNGARVIRLDAIAFIWKSSGTPCVHLLETHEIIKLLRLVIDYCAPDVILITETNVPHLENISYFGRGDEAHMVYQFPLPPLLLFTMNMGNAGALTRWAASLDDPGEKRTWFNFTASHDGIGVRPLEGLVSRAEINGLVDNMINFGALISNRRRSDGTEEPYEINITYFDAMKGTGNKPDNFQVDRFLCSQLIMMSLKGVPAFYIHSMFGTPNDYNAAAMQIKNRAINRRKYWLFEIESIISGRSYQAGVFGSLQHFIKLRKAQSAFHPDAAQEILDIGMSFFAFIRSNHETGQTILCISNISSVERRIVAVKDIQHFKYDLLTRQAIGSQEIVLKPYQTVWLV